MHSARPGSPAGREMLWEFKRALPQAKSEGEWIRKRLRLHIHMRDAEVFRFEPLAIHSSSRVPVVFV